MSTAPSQLTHIPGAEFQTTGPKKIKVLFLTLMCPSKTVNTSHFKCFPFSDGK